MNKYNVKDGIYYLDIELSKLEFELFREFEDMLLKKGYKYLSSYSPTVGDVVCLAKIGNSWLVLGKIV